MKSEQNVGCDCASRGDRVRINLGAETADLLEQDYHLLRDRNPWLRAVNCRRCSQPWYVAIDTVDDDYYFRRLTAVELADILERGDWPADFDRFVNVWPLKEERNFEARLHWPWKDEDVDVR